MWAKVYPESMESKNKIVTWHYQITMKRITALDGLLPFLLQRILVVSVS